jgi:signal transduction histidine kinase
MGPIGGAFELSQVSIVLIEEDDDDADLIVQELVSAGLEPNVLRATDEAHLRAALTGVDSVDAVLCAYYGKGVKVWQALEIIKASLTDAPLIVVSRGLSDEQAAECMRLGAADYILKDRLGRLPHALTQAINHARAEHAGRESEGRLRSLVAGAPVAVTTLDRDGRFTFVGGTVFSQMQVNPSSPFGLLATDAFDNRPDLLELWTNALERDLQTDLEFGGRTFHVRSGPFRLTPEGEVIGVRAVALDITERVEAEQRLSRRVAQQTVLLELSRAGLEGRETEDFLATAVELVARGTETQFGTIVERGPSYESLIQVAAYGHSEGISPASFPLDASSRHALRSETPVVVLDYDGEAAPARTPWMVESGVLTSMTVAISGPVRSFGLLSVYSNVERDFNADDLQFIQLASTIVSVAVERKSAEKQRRMLLSRLVTAQEAERKTIAEDIHDDAVQIMTAANMRLELFRMVLTDPAQVDAAQKLQETISLAIGRLRNLLFELIPPDLDRHGLEAAFRRHLEQSEAHAGIAWELEAELDEEPAPQVRILLFRIFQEALMNVRKHAKATSVAASLKTVEGGVMMRLSDDGAGFHASAAEPLAGHLGLASMRERAEIAGGWWRLTTEPGRGTEITTWVPAPRSGLSSAVLTDDVMALG